MAKLYYKKICSLHPTKYKFLEISKATKKYQEYIDIVFSNPNVKDSDIKNFSDWLKTEI